VNDDLWPLVEETLDHVEAHPEAWDQGTYGRRTPCGFRACFAGTLLVRSGRYRFDHHFVDATTGARVSAGDAFQELLGLTLDQRCAIAGWDGDDPTALRAQVYRVLKEEP